MIPGPIATPWEKGLFPVELEFTEAYPSKPPECRFPKGFFHPNGRLLFAHVSALARLKARTHFKVVTVCAVYPSGKVCLSIVNADQAWKPAISVKQVLLEDTMSDSTPLLAFFMDGPACHADTDRHTTHAQ